MMFSFCLTPALAAGNFEQDKDRGGGGEGFYVIFRKKYRIFKWKDRKVE
jgi:hypothetical protein